MFAGRMVFIWSPLLNGIASAKGSTLSAGLQLLAETRPFLCKLWSSSILSLCFICFGSKSRTARNVFSSEITKKTNHRPIDMHIHNCTLSSYDKPQSDTSRSQAQHLIVSQVTNKEPTIWNLSILLEVRFGGKSYSTFIYMYDSNFIIKVIF